MDMTLAVEGLVNLFVNMDGTSRVMFIRLLVTKMKDEEVDVFLQVIHLKQKAESNESNDGDFSNYLDIELKQEPDEFDADSYSQSTSWWSTDEDIKDQETSSESEKQETIKAEKREISLDTQKEKAHYYCDKCDERYEKKTDLISHIETVHEGIPNLGISKLRLPKEKKYYYCDKCDKKCGKKSDLINHMETVHEGMRFPCDLCDYKATRKWNLQTHIKRYHLGITTERKQYEKRFVCDKCSKKFSHNCELIRHMEEIHEGIRYPCDKCDYQATKKWHLQQHVEAEHKGVRYPCGKCNYLAKTKQTLQRHVESIHEGIRYPCDYCEYKATQIPSLKKHIQQNHNNVQLSHPENSTNLSSQNPCPQKFASNSENSSVSSSNVLLHSESLSSSCEFKAKKHIPQNCINAESENSITSLSPDKSFPTQKHMRQNCSGVQLTSSSEDCIFPSLNYSTTPFRPPSQNSIIPISSIYSSP